MPLFHSAMNAGCLSVIVIVAVLMGIITFCLSVMFLGGGRDSGPLHDLTAIVASAVFGMILLGIRRSLSAKAGRGQQTPTQREE